MADSWISTFLLVGPIRSNNYGSNLPHGVILSNESHERKAIANLSYIFFRKKGHLSIINDQVSLRNAQVPLIGLQFTISQVLEPSYSTITIVGLEGICLH